MEIFLRSIQIEEDRVKYRSLFGTRSDFHVSEVVEAHLAPSGRLKVKLQTGKSLVFYSNERTTREVARKLGVKSGKSDYYY
jgi:hypothetical protein